MPARLALTLISWLVGCTMLLTTGCSGCDTASGPCPESPCGLTEQCVQGTCVGITDVVCIPSCGDDQTCNRGDCVDVVDVCTAPGQFCEPREPINGDFFCIDWDGFTQGSVALCSSPCSTEGACGEGEACFVLSGLDEPACQVQSDCGVGRLCLQNKCAAAACRPAECLGILDGAASCSRTYKDDPAFALGANCAQLDVNTCVPAGPRNPGEACVDLEVAQANGDFSQTCGQGLGCLNGRCQTPCATDDACDGEQVCISADQDLLGTGLGFCGTPCAPFTSDSCEGGQKCYPVSGQIGYCVDAGPKRVFELCTPESFECEEGTWCVPEAQGQARCMAMCNLTVAPPEGETTVTPVDQLQRDATCPQPDDQAVSFLRVLHLAQGLGPVDIYADRGVMPLAQGVEPGEIASFSMGMSSLEYTALDPGTHVIEVRLAGAPAQSAPVLERSLSLQRDQGHVLTLGDTPASQSERVVSFSTQAQARAEGVRVVQSAPDVSGVDVVVYPFQQPQLLGSPVVLAQNVSARTWSSRVGIASGSYRAILWPQGSPQDSIEQALFVSDALVLTNAAQQELRVWGTLNPNDTLALQVDVRASNAPPEPKLGPAPLSCSSFGNQVFGACEQVCQGPRAYGADVCDGEGLGCTPVERGGFGEWVSLCKPFGEVPLGGACSPRTTNLSNSCGEGAYCLTYGNAAPNYDALLPGRCAAYCDAQGEIDELSCPQQESCQRLDSEFDVGRCGFACEPTGEYSAPNCPDGLGKCLPRSSEVTRADGSSGVETLQAFCSASGVSTSGMPCGSTTCVPGTECLFPRSAQTALVSTLLSPYFGGGGQPASCTPQCDPFDGVASNVRCGEDETCLVNFPWSADVGHCAPIVERAVPFGPCSRPGESCGDDSVCVLDGATPFCLRLCQYTGGPGVGVSNQSTCPLGYECGNLVDDVGFCQVP